MIFFLLSAARARASTDHFFFLSLSPDFDEIDKACGFGISLSCSTIPKRTHVLLAFSHTYILLASDLNELWHRVMTICLLNKFKRQWAMAVLRWVTVSVREQLWDVSKLEFLSQDFRKF